MNINIDDSDDLLANINAAQQMVHLTANFGPNILAAIIIFFCFLIKIFYDYFTAIMIVFCIVVKIFVSLYL